MKHLKMLKTVRQFWHIRVVMKLGAEAVGIKRLKLLDIKSIIEPKIKITLVIGNSELPKPKGLGFLFHRRQLI